MQTFAVTESSLCHFLPAPPLQVIQNPHTTGLLRPNCQENIWHVDCFQFWDQQQQFGLLREWWAHSEDAPLNQHDGYYFITNVQTLRENKNFPLNPLGREIVRTGLFETQTPKDPHTGRTIKQFYGQRMRGLMRPLKTGTYRRALQPTASRLYGRRGRWPFTGFPPGAYGLWTLATGRREKQWRSWCPR